MSDCRTEREQLWEGASFRIRRMARGCPGPLFVGGWRGLRTSPSWRRGSAVPKEQRVWSLERTDLAERDKGCGVALTCSRMGLVAGLVAAGRPEQTRRGWRAVASLRPSPRVDEERVCPGARTEPGSLRPFVRRQLVAVGPCTAACECAHARSALA